MYEKQELLSLTQKVMDRLMTLAPPEIAGEKDVYKKGVAPRDFGIEEWDWPQGVGIYGMEKLQALLGDTRYDEFLTQFAEKNIKAGMPSKNINTTAPYITLLSLARRTKNDRYMEMCRERAQWLMDELPKTKEGGFQHVTSGINDKNAVTLNESELWIDTLFMAVLFLARAGAVFEREDWAQEAVHQILLHIKYLYEKRTGLFYHGFSFNRNDNFGGIFWCRGNSWFTYGITELLSALGAFVGGGARAFIAETFAAQAEALRALQSESGLWHTILDDSTSYLETSGSAAIAAGMFRGVREGLLSEAFLPTAWRALEGVIKEISPDGLVQNVSGGTGIGLNAEHYKKIIIAPLSYGQSMTAFALMEAASIK